MVLGSLVFGLVLVHSAFAFQNCPLLGADFPIPSSYSNSLAVQNAISSIRLAIDEGLQNGDLENVTSSFSIEIFSRNETLLAYHHSAPNLSPDGVQTVDSNSIYRIGSISKLFTVYMHLIEAGDAHFNEPVSKYVPELANLSHTDSLNTVDWDSVTIGNLASQMAGIGRDVNAILGELLQLVPEDYLVAVGFPPLNISEIPSCVLGEALCSRKEFFDGFKNRHPVFRSSTTPIYSNAAFSILAYATEAITGIPYEKMLEKNILTPLNLIHTTYSQPKNSTYGVIPVNQTVSGWDLDIGEAGPAGSFYSSTSDISRLGRAILSSQLLSPAQTRRWLKPVTHTSSLHSSVGAPWEISRYLLPQTSRIVDLYTKDGSLAAYNSELALVPDWGVGFIVLEAGITSETSLTPILVSNIISNVLFPALDAAARNEAANTYTGTYAAKNGLNSSIIISVGDTSPGLGVESWISNGTNLFTIISPVVTPGYNTSVRLYASGLEAKLANGKQVGWRALIEPNATFGSSGPFSDPCYTWGGVDNLMYNEVAIDEFLFTVGENGVATSIEARAFGAVLEKV